MESTAIPSFQGIQVSEQGLRLNHAQLLLEDGSPLNDAHRVGLGELIYCRLFISGWHAEQGVVRPGASEYIRTADGALVLGADDLFRDIAGTSEADASVVTLRAGITNNHAPATAFEVAFRVWDKATGAALAGSFTFQIGETTQQTD